MFHLWVSQSLTKPDGRPWCSFCSQWQEIQLQMLLHLPNEEPTPPVQLWRESAVISLIKPLRKLLQHQTDELSKADLLAEDK